MKQISILLLLTFIAAGTFAQNIALDWSKDDCEGTSHSLYSELDNGVTIICEYVMVPTCQPCITAGGYIQTIRDNFEATHPGKVRWYSTAFNNAYTCSQMQNWTTTNSLTPDAEFTQGDAEVDYYGGMGMPTIVVVGGGTLHKVYYQEQGFSSGDVVDIEAAINTSLAEATGIVDTGNDPFSLNVYPNPAASHATISFTLNSSDHISVEVYNLVGTKVVTVLDKIQSAGRHELNLNTSAIPNGSYFLKLKIGEATKIISLRIVH